MGARVGAALGLTLMLATTVAPAAVLHCNVGPVTKTYGKTSWWVYSCHDYSNIVVVTTPGSPAAPFYFFISVTRGEIQLRGEGTGRQDLTDAAYKDLNLLKGGDVAKLIAETAKPRKHDSHRTN